MLSHYKFKDGILIRYEPCKFAWLNSAKMHGLVDSENHYYHNQ